MIHFESSEKNTKKVEKTLKKVLTLGNVCGNIIERPKRGNAV